MAAILARMASRWGPTRGASHSNVTSACTMVPPRSVTLITLDEDNVIAPVDIINHTAEYFKLTVDDLYGSSRSQAVATARQIAMYLCREMTNLSLPKIGQLFGNRDHTTVMYANKKITELMKERRSIYNQVTELTSRIKQNHRFNKH